MRKPAEEFPESKTAQIRDSEFREIADLVYDNFGIHLGDQKKMLVVSRLQKILRQDGHLNFSAYIEYLKTDRSGRALSDLVNRISTNHTFFNRENAHFDFFKNTVLPYWKSKAEKSGAKDLRVWCAGCATGEEAYMLVILLLEFFGSDYSSWKAGLLATDISESALETAKRGVYSAERVSEMPADLLKKYFKKASDGDYVVDEKLKREITWGRFNLMETKLPFQKAFHVIFCRNVMIYFDKPTREALVQRFHDFTCPGGYFFVGHSESLRPCPYDFIQPAVYRKREF